MVGFFERKVTPAPAPAAKAELTISEIINNVTDKFMENKFEEAKKYLEEYKGRNVSKNINGLIHDKYTAIDYIFLMANVYAMPGTDSKGRSLAKNITNIVNEEKENYDIAYDIIKFLHDKGFRLNKEIIKQPKNGSEAQNEYFDKVRNLFRVGGRTKRNKKHLRRTRRR